MNGEVHLIVTSGGIDTATYSGTLSTNIVAGLTTFTLSGNTSTPFPCNDPSIVTLVGGVLTVEDADVNGTANIIGWDANTCEITIDNAILYSGPVPADDGCTITYTITSVEQKYIDLFENESISQNWKFQDLSNFTAQGAFSREFRVPYSENNQLALGALFDVNNEAGADNYFHYKLPAEIRVDTLPIASGYLRVRKIYKQLNRINEVELAFYAETPDLVRNIGEKKLKDIADLPNLDEVIQYDNVTNPSANRIWTLCDRGQLWSEQGEVNARSLSNAASPLYASDLTPALNWWYLFNNIITESGFELVAGTLQNILEGYWMPWCNSQRLIGSDTYGDLLFGAENSVFQSIGGAFPIKLLASVELFDNNNNYNPLTSGYTTPSNGYYTFNVTISITPTALVPDIPGEVYLYLVIDGIITPVLATLTFPQEAFATVSRSATFTIGIDAASNVFVYALVVNNPTAVQIKVTSYSLVNVSLSFGQSIDYSGSSPDMRQIDFVTDVLRMHNCAIISDRITPNKIYIIPQNSYLGTGNELDWTSKLDVSKDVVISSAVDLQKAKFQFTYTAGEDYLSQLYKNVNRIYGDYEAIGYTTNPNIAPSDFAIGDQKIQLVTQSTPCGIVPGTTLAIPQFLSDSQEFVAPGPRCLYEAGSYDVQLYDDSTSTTVLTTVPILNHYSVINADIDDYDLNWSPEVPPHPIITNPFNNLFNLYWRTYMNALYSPEARIMEASFALDLKDILTFQFSDKVWIQNAWWRILEINDYKIGMNESTQVKLIKFLENTEDCSATPVSIGINGEVNFENGAGDPVAATQDCCTRYGYNWDESTGSCWAFTLNNNRPTSTISGRPTAPATRNTPTTAISKSIPNSLIGGTNVLLATGNRDMLAVGSKLELTKDVQGSNLLGKNTYTNLPGIHLGGGYRSGNTANTEKGWAQSGTVILHYKDAWLDSQTFNLDIEGIAAEYLELPNDTIWSCLMNATILDTGTGDYCIGQYSFGLQKIGGNANATPVTVINEDNGTAYNFAFGIDTVANAAQHRINLTVTGLGISTETFIVTASIQYQQNTSV